MLDLFRSDNVVVRSVPTADKRRWVVTFDNYGLGHGFERPGFGQQYLKQAGISAIHVMGRQEDWYQYAEMPEALASVRHAVSGAERVMAYGSSMGGYAAIRFADAAGANATLALSPQYSIDPAKAPFEQRWPQDSERLQFLDEIEGRLANATCPVIVYDSIGLDQKHVSLIAAHIPVTAIALPFSGHPSSTYLGDLGLLHPLVMDVLNGTLDSGAFRQAARAERAASPTYLTRLAELQPDRRHALGLALAKRAHASAPGSIMAMSTYASFLSKAERHDEALALLAEASRRSGRASVYLLAEANALLAANRDAEALALAKEVVTLLPRAAHVWAWLGAVHWKLGAAEDAFAAVQQAVALHPTNATYQDLAACYRPRPERASLPAAKVSRVLKFVKRRASAALGSH